jgi:hypothetical protein
MYVPRRALLQSSSGAWAEMPCSRRGRRWCAPAGAAGACHGVPSVTGRRAGRLSLPGCASAAAGAAACAARRGGRATACCAAARRACRPRSCARCRSSSTSAAAARRSGRRRHRRRRPRCARPVGARVRAARPARLTHFLHLLESCDRGRCVGPAPRWLACHAFTGSSSGI